MESVLRAEAKFSYFLIEHLPVSGNLLTKAFGERPIEIHYVYLLQRPMLFLQTVF